MNLYHRRHCLSYYHFIYYFYHKLNILRLRHCLGLKCVCRTNGHIEHEQEHSSVFISGSLKCSTHTSSPIKMTWVVGGYIYLFVIQMMRPLIKAFYISMEIYWWYFSSQWYERRLCHHCIEEQKSNFYISNELFTNRTRKTNCITFAVYNFSSNKL